MVVDIRIMAHPSRKKNVRCICDKLKLSDEHVVWDDRSGFNDAMYTARKAWNSPLPDGCTHRLVIQDDAELCDGFKEIVEQVATRFSNEIISFFHYENFNHDGRYHKGRVIWGVAVMIPTHLLSDLWYFVDNEVVTIYGKNAEEYLRKDTKCIRLWKDNREIPYYVTTPSLVQHIGDESLVGITTIRRAPDYISDPPMDGW